MASADPGTRRQLAAAARDRGRERRPGAGVPFDPSIASGIDALGGQSVDRLLIDAALSGALSAALLAASQMATPAAADDFYAVVDLRAVASDGERSFLDGGLGELRFDGQHDGLRLGSVSLGYHHDFFEIVHFNANAVAYGDRDRSPVDLTEAYAEVRPYPWNSWRS